MARHARHLVFGGGVMLALCASSAAAQAIPDSAREAKSPRHGSRLSLGATLIPVAAGVLLHASGGTSGTKTSLGSLLIAGGVLVGPSVGHFYAGSLGFLPYRLLSAGAGIGAAVATGDQVGNWLPFLAVIPIAAFVIVDLTTADGAARRWNRKHGLAITLSPGAFHARPGLTVSARMAW